MLAAGFLGVIVWWPGSVGTTVVLTVWTFGVLEYVKYMVHSGPCLAATLHWIGGAVSNTA
ncbi:hypothetical protein [Agromyces sp. Soil535]|uniref:hypothetical protein n=1 Tax=Agromyces sp. Soil535 TaxID=1736390 RepID=UPI0006F6C5ED|nr:hypothetical protein [Agromyces sp. Soil535]KRE30452.1 hypothetical protein ASG80_17005 [Agromyces sp. Soil535]